MKKITMLFALTLATMTLCAQNDHSMKPSNSNKDHKLFESSKYLDLNRAMRKLWSDHMFWTLSTVDAYFNEPQQVSVKLNRLLENQKQIGAAIVPYYGQAAGDQLTKLLTEHIQGAVPVLKAAKENDKAALDKALADWYKNAKEIADFLSSANGANWPASVTESALKMHITQTTEYATNILKGDVTTSIKNFEEALGHMLMLADILSDGIAKQFPEKFRKD